MHVSESLCCWQFLGLSRNLCFDFLQTLQKQAPSYYKRFKQVLGRYCVGPFAKSRPHMVWAVFSLQSLSNLFFQTLPYHTPKMPVSFKGREKKGQQGKHPRMEYAICAQGVQPICTDLSVSTRLVCSPCHVTTEQEQKIPCCTKILTFTCWDGNPNDVVQVWQECLNSHCFLELLTSSYPDVKASPACCNVSFILSRVLEGW